MGHWPDQHCYFKVQNIIENSLQLKKSSVMGSSPRQNNGN